MAVLQGSAELAAELRALPDEVAKGVLRPSAIAGARVVRDQVKVNAPVARKPVRRYSGQLSVPGTIKRAVVLKFAPEKSNRDQQTYVVAIRKGKSQQRAGRDAFYWLWVEQGHKVVGRSGRVIGQAPPHPFFVPAYRATAAIARQKMKARMEAGLADVLRQQTYLRVSGRNVG